MLIKNLFYNEFTVAYSFLFESNSTLVVLLILTLLNLHILFTWFYVLDDFYNQVKWIKKFIKFKFNIVEIVFKVLTLLLFFIFFLSDISFYIIIRKFFFLISSWFNSFVNYNVLTKISLIKQKIYYKNNLSTNHAFILFNKSDFIINLINSKLFINNFNSLLYW